MDKFSLPISIVLCIAGLYLFLALYLMCRLFSGWAIGNLRKGRHSSPEPPLPAWIPPSEALDKHKD